MIESEKSLLAKSEIFSIVESEKLLLVKSEKSLLVKLDKSLIVESEKFLLVELEKFLLMKLDKSPIVESEKSLLAESEKSLLVKPENFSIVKSKKILLKSKSNKKIADEDDGINCCGVGINVEILFIKTEIVEEIDETIIERELYVWSMRVNGKLVIGYDGWT